LTDIVFLRESKKGLTFDIHVIPHASRVEMVGVQEGALKVKVTVPPVEGAANEACIKLLAKELGLKKSQLEIASGAKSRKKTIMVKDINKVELETKINNICKTNLMITS
jgi:hypothetical protein